MTEICKKHKCILVIKEDIIGNEYKVCPKCLENYYSNETNKPIGDKKE